MAVWMHDVGRLAGPSVAAPKLALFGAMQYRLSATESSNAVDPPTGRGYDVFIVS